MPIHFKDRNTTDRALADAGLGPTVDASIQLEVAINQLQLPLDQEIGLYSVEQYHGAAAAQHVLTAMKEAKSPLLMRQKAAMTPADDFDRLGQQFAEATRAAALQPGASQSQILKWAQSIIAQLAPVQGRATLTDSGDQSVLPGTQKAAAPSLGDIINNAYDHISREGIH